jgi:nucleoside-diphosphate-sugar epimerase
MRIFVAGASGVVGRHLLPVLVKAGHQVTGMSTSENKRGLVESLGAHHVAADALDREAVLREVTRARPDVVIHQATAIPQELNLRKFEQQFDLTNRLRSQGTDNLLAGARAAGARKFIAQSYAGWPYARVGGPVKTEEDPLDPNPPAVFRTGLAAIRHLEDTVSNAAGIQGIVLRYGSFYGPDSSGVWIVEQVRKHDLPIVGDGGAVWSFLHMDDMASATLAAAEGNQTGIFNVVDDDPAAVSVWIPELARIVHARPPARVPAWIARLAIGEAGIIMMTEARGSSNQKAKSQLGWSPRWKSWRDGFRDQVAQERQARVA